VRELVQGIHARVGDQHDVAASATVSPGGATERHILLTPKGSAAVAAISSVNAEGTFVDELHRGAVF
jgi:hypothetical protein